MNIPVSQSVDTLAGRTSTGPFITVINSRPPTVNDINYLIGQRWIDTSSENTELFLLNFISSNGVVQANWVPLFSATGGFNLTGNSGTIVTPDSSQNINIFGDSSGIQFAGSSHTLTASLANIPNSSLANSSITLNPGTGIDISSSPVALGGSTTISVTDDIPDSFPTDSGTAVPIANSLSILGGTGVTTSGAGNIITISSTGAFATSYDTDSGTAMPAAGVLSILGTGGASTSGSGSTVTVNSLTLTKFVVGTGDGANYATIQDAMNAASAGDTIFVTTGTYPDDFTFKPHVNVAAFPCDYETPNVLITGKATMSSAGVNTITGVAFQTNSTYCVVMSGSANCLLRIEGCYFDCNNNSGILVSNSNASSQMYIRRCDADLGTNTANLLEMTGGAGVLLYQNHCTNSGGSTNGIKVSAGFLTVNTSTLILSIVSDSTGGIVVRNSLVFSAVAAAIRLSGTGSSIDDSVILSSIASVVSSCIIINSSRTLICANNVLNTGTGTALSGSGTVRTGANACQGGSGNTVSTRTNLTVI